MSGVSPVAIGVLGLAPAFRSSSTSGALPLVQASDSGVMRKSFAAFASAPARISRSAVATSFQCAAHSSAVEPSSDRTFTSARWLSSARTCCWSWFLAASTSRRSRSAAAAPATISSTIENAPATPLLLYPSRMPFPLWLVSDNDFRRS